MNKLQKNTVYKRQTGLTLIEIMVALTISLILLGGVYTIYISTKTSYKTQEGLSRVQENARFALDMLSRNLRVAGLLGCDSKGSNIKINNIAKPESGQSSDSVTYLGDNNAIKGFRNPDAADLTELGLNAGQVKADTDVIQVRYVSDADCQVNDRDVENANIKVVNTCEVLQNEVVLVSDCSDGDLFRVTNVVTGNGGERTIAHASSGNTTNRLSKQYGSDAALLVFNNDIYFIGTGASGDDALFKRSLINGTPTDQEIVDGVENMQVLYGIDDDGDATPNQYVALASVPTKNGEKDFSVVKSVRIALLLHTTSTAGNVYGNPTSGDVAPQKQPFLDVPFFLTSDKTSEPVAGDFTTPNDRRLRRVFTTTIKLRNRL